MSYYVDDEEIEIWINDHTKNVSSWKRISDELN